MKKKTVFKWLNRVVSTALTILLIAVAGLVLTTKLSGGEPQVFGYQFKTVLSGSMEPEFMTGSVIAVEPIEGDERHSLKEGDVITFMESENKLITHRIIEVKETGNGAFYTTKGDNNNAPDTNSVLAENVVAKYTGFTIPFLGYAVNFAQTQNGAFLLLIPGLFLVGYSLFTIWQALRELDKMNKKHSSEKESAATN